MERLTFEGNFCEIAMCCEVPGGSFCEDDGCSQKKVWERLKEYEDTGLTPELCARYAKADREGRYIVMRDAEQAGVARMRELGKADAEGRVMVLPCKIGDTVWAVNSFGISSHQIRRIEKNKQGSFACSCLLFPFEDFSKTVFLTREEAAETLEAKSNA